MSDVFLLCDEIDLATVAALEAGLRAAAEREVLLEMVLRLCDWHEQLRRNVNPGHQRIRARSSEPYSRDPLQPRG